MQRILQEQTIRLSQPYDRSVTEHPDDRRRDELEAATELWEHLAAFAWDQFVTFGRGVVLMRASDLFAARGALCAGKSPPPDFAPGFVPLTHIPPGDDFRALIGSLNPREQLALLVQRDDDSDAENREQLYVLETAGSARLPPEECYFAQQARAE